MNRKIHGRRIVSALALCALAVAGCGDDDAADNVAESVAGPPASTALPPDDTPNPTTPATDSAPTTQPPTDSAVPAPSLDELEAQIATVLTTAIAPGSIKWDSSGVDVPPTAAVAAVRVPGSEDMLVAVGTNVDGTPAEADAPFFVGTLAESLVRNVAFQLVDEGVLDPATTIDQWVPTLPNADRVTVQMAIDNTTGWSNDPLTINPDPVVTDLARAWSLREVVELRATTITALAEPGTRTTDGIVNEALLGLIVEDVSGQPLAQVIDERIADLVGLDDTVLAGADWTAPHRWRHGVLAFNGSKLDTSAFDDTSYVTWNHATGSAASTPVDLLDLLDAWATGELFTTDRTPAPGRYAPEPADNPLDFHAGLGVPWNGFCPCTEVDGGIEPNAIGRTPAGVGTRTWLLRYADGISVVVNVNTDEADPADIRAVANEVHDIAAAAI